MKVAVAVEVEVGVGVWVVTLEGLAERVVETVKKRGARAVEAELQMKVSHH